MTSVIRLVSAIAVVWLPTASFLASEVPAHVAMAGWAEVEITPPLGIGLGGRGGPETLANKILSPLFGQVLFLKDGKGRGFVLVSLDVVAIAHDLSDRIRTDIVQELGVDWNLVVLNASHTHSGPYMIRSLIAGLGPPPPVETEYFNSLQEKILGAARQAAKALQPVEIKTFEAISQIGINRRGKNKQGRRAIIPDVQGPYDEKVWVMKLSPKNGGPPAVLFSQACHPVIVYGYDFGALSADFPGTAREALREKLGVSSHVQFVQGFAGNIRPRALADLDNGRFRASKPEDVQRVGKELAASVGLALESRGEPLELNLAGTSDRPFLPRDKPPPRDFYEKMKHEALVKTNAFQVGVSDYWLQRYDRNEGFARGDAWSVGLIRLAANQWIVHSGGEPCIEWRAKISEWLSPLKLVAWGYCQEAKSYLPTESMLPEGGYEVLESNQARASTPAPFAPGIEAAMRQSLLRQLAFIKAGKNDQ